MGGVFSQGSTHAPGKSFFSNKYSVPGGCHAIDSVLKRSCYIMIHKRARPLQFNKPWASRSSQMLLVPVDADMGHKDASYAAVAAHSGDSAHLVAAEDGVHKEAVLLPPLKPSASLLARGVEISDDEEEVEGEEVGNIRPSSPMRQQGPEQVSLEWEDITRQSASQAEIEAAVEQATNQHAWDDLQPVPTSKGGDGRMFRNLHGQWATTNVLRHDSVPGTLYLFEDTLVFESDSCASDGNAAVNPSWLMLSLIHI